MVAVSTIQSIAFDTSIACPDSMIYIVCGNLNSGFLLFRFECITAAMLGKTFSTVTSASACFSSYVSSYGFLILCPQCFACALNFGHQSSSHMIPFRCSMKTSGSKMCPGIILVRLCITCSSTSNRSSGIAPIRSLFRSAQF